MTDLTQEPTPEIKAELTQTLMRLGLVWRGREVRYTALTGGVSSDIWLVETGGRKFCVKRALAQLKVEADWQAPVERNAYEVAWMRAAANFTPAAVPKVLEHDPDSGLFVMDYMDPAKFALWKTELRDGRADPFMAARVGAVIAAIHAGTADDPEVAKAFASDEIFHAIRLEPYLEAAARAHPDLADALMGLVEVTANTKRVLVHGDVSPKNILIGRDGPVLLDAECAWFGDPAFDPAFCLNHLLLKCLWAPAASGLFLECFRELADAYLDGVWWEPIANIEARIARLLPGLLLARVDGKSPAEYVTEVADKALVRRIAGQFLTDPVTRLSEVAEAWRTGLEERA
jgi:aminoglycoside phosphotransferase (APT) family kinase protein